MFFISVFLHIVSFILLFYIFCFERIITKYHLAYLLLFLLNLVKLSLILLLIASIIYVSDLPLAKNVNQKPQISKSTLIHTIASGIYHWYIYRFVVKFFRVIYCITQTNATILTNRITITQMKFILMKFAQRKMMN